MGFIYKKEGNACERCKKLNDEVGKMSDFNKYEMHLLLCENCIKEIEEEQNRECPKCHLLLKERNGISSYEDKEMCSICADEMRYKKAKRLVTENFFKSHWKFWITLSVMIIIALVASL